LEVPVVYQFCLSEQLLIPAEGPQSHIRVELFVHGTFLLLVEVASVLLIRLRGTVLKERSMMLHVFEDEFVGRLAVGGEGGDGGQLPAGWRLESR
jgi:hypothetical protein